MATEFPVRVKILPVEQSGGIFYVAVIPARVLLETCYSERLSAKPSSETGSYELVGAQRAQNPTRLKEIARHINTADICFPNTIILAPNYDQTTGVLIEDAATRWSVCCNGQLELIIPTSAKIAPVIDGQHRLFSFSLAKPEKLDTELVCSIFLDLPKPYQAFLFATINSTQKPVDKSLTYELFGYNIENEDPVSWSPEKLAVFVVRKLNTEEDSVLHGRVLLAAENDFVMSRAEARKQQRWMISMATVVDGIVRLFSQNPKRDAHILNERLEGKGYRSRRDLIHEKDDSPLRGEYISGNDKVIFLMIKNYLHACNDIFWANASDGSYIIKTIGLQALFDIFRKIAHDSIQEKDISYEFFVKTLSKAAIVDFSAPLFVNASGTGRQKIRTAIEIQLGLQSIEDVPAGVRESYINAGVVPHHKQDTHS
jgi:DNA phosphorothioation-associated DGQHR protein 1